jgi:hypothetical protein
MSTPNFYVEAKGTSYTSCPVPFDELDRAIECARRFKADAMRVIVWDMRSNPYIGTNVFQIG